MPPKLNQAAPAAETAPEINASDTSDLLEETPLKLSETLLKTFFTGLSWTAAARGLTSVGTALRYVVFVRLLRPFDFGVIASATLVCAALSAATETRMGQALIQQQDRIDPYLDTLFTINFVRSLIIGLIMVVARIRWATFSIWATPIRSSGRWCRFQSCARFRARA